VGFKDTFVETVKQQSSKAARRVRSTVMATGCHCWSSKHESMGALVTDSMARQKLLAFGVYPADFLAKARQCKDQAREQLADGVDRAPIRNSKHESLPLSVGVVLKVTGCGCYCAR
jgi:hypothetical protein